MSDDTERRRKCRRLRAAGKIPLLLWLSEDNLVAALLDARLLHPNDADDRDKVIEATERYIEATTANVPL